MKPAQDERVNFSSINESNSNVESLAGGSNNKSDVIINFSAYD